MDLHLWQGFPFCHQAMTQFLQRVAAIGDQLPDKYLGTRHNLTLQPGLIAARDSQRPGNSLPTHKLISSLLEKELHFPILCWENSLSEPSIEAQRL